MKNNKNILGFYGSHDASVTYLDKKGKIRILEFERFSKKRYAMYSDRFDHRTIGTNNETRSAFLNYVSQDIKTTDDLVIAYNELSETDIAFIKKHFEKAKFIQCNHHQAHAYCAYYQSPYKTAHVISLDGGGLDNGAVSMSKVFYADKDKVEEIFDPKIDLGNPYAKLGYVISEINHGYDGQKMSLAYAGKIMGLCAYGNARMEWLKPMQKYYKHKSLDKLAKDIGLILGQNSLSGQVGFDLAATSQHVFEDIAFNLVKNVFDKKNDNIILTGGCALNVLFNQKLKLFLKNTDYDLFVPPNPNDCGLSFGQYCMFNNVKHNDILYNGFPVLDLQKLDAVVKNYNAKKIKTSDIVDLLSQGKIIGLVYGDSEVGPRALGNRSIICDPSFKNMKDVLNLKVKFREWFRPFAPVSLLEDAPVFFDDAFESPYMSYAPKVKEEYQNILKAITHVDGTSRLQTVTKGQHKLFYDILVCMKKNKKTPVLLNTSFNIKGYPILTTIEDALYVLNNTELDHVIIQGYLFSKKGL